MNKHEFLDKTAAGFGALYGESIKFFNRSVESDTISRTIKEITLPAVPEITGEEEEYSVTAHWKDRSLSTRFRIVQWCGPDKPSLIFHHGSGDQPYYRRIEKIMKPGEGMTGRNIIATDSPFNRTGKEYMHAVGELQDFVLIFAVSTVLIEQIIARLREEATGLITVSGISLGGWISNLHHSYFGSADEYRPVFAGAAPDDLFLNSAYKKLTSRKALSTPETLNNVLNFEKEFRKRGGENVYPLLARYDKYIRYERQKQIYRPGQVSTLDKGHVTGSGNTKEIQNFLLRE